MALSYVDMVCRLLLCTVFACSVAGKLRGRSAFDGFAGTVRRWSGFRRGTAVAVAAVVVAAELAAVALLLLPGATAVGLGLAIALLIVLSAGIGLALRRGVDEPCRCFGVARRPVSRWHLARNGCLAATALVGLAVPDGRPENQAMAGTLMAAAVGVVLGWLTVQADDLADLFAMS